MSNKNTKTVWQNKVTLWRIFLNYRSKMAVTWLLLVLEAISILLIPLLIGLSVDGLVNSEYFGLYLLASLSFAVLIIGAGLRFYDTRIYARIFQDLAFTLFSHEKEHKSTTSVITARVNLLNEIIEFFENSLPMLLSNIISFVGVVIIVSTLDHYVMAICILASVLIVLIYVLTSHKFYDYNQNQNNEFEKQVTIFTEGKAERVKSHYAKLMIWNVKLSDLETINFSLVWLILGSLLIGSIFLIVNNGSASYGQKITAIMYIFQFIEVVMNFPIFYQQFVRLTEISHRLSIGKTD